MVISLSKVVLFAITGKIIKYLLNISINEKWIIYSGVNILQRAGTEPKKKVEDFAKVSTKEMNTKMSKQEVH